MYKVLVVDDENAIREVLQEALEGLGYDVATACDGPEALQALQARPCDMILSDINMPKMTGFELLREVATIYPDMKRVLMTACNLDDYMRMVRDHNIGNVIPKTVPLRLGEITQNLNNLLRNDVFGLERYMRPGFTLQEFFLSEPSQIDSISESVSEFYGESPIRHKFRVVLIELMTNALFYGARDELGDAKQDWNKNFRLTENEAVRVTVAIDNEKFAVSVLDFGGKLDKHTVLYWLDRQTTQDEKGLPCGVFDYQGRGFFITRKYVDKLIINIEKGRRSECCIFNYFDETYSSNKPLIINEV